MKKGFTLAEIMIVLGIIAVLTGILLPVAFQAAPDENVLKFKKATLTFGTAIRELIGSDRYFADGDLGKKPDGTITETPEYFCNAFADIVNTKSYVCGTNVAPTNCSLASLFSYDGTTVTLDTFKASLDSSCKMQAYPGGMYSPTGSLSTMVSEFKLVDGVLITTFSCSGFGISGVNATTGEKLREYFADPSSTDPPPQHDENNLDTAYMLFCVDVDGYPANATQNNCVNECPFGIGVRSDGKILYGARAEEWLKKEVQSKD